MKKIGGERMADLTELSGNFEQDKRLIKMMITQLANHAEESATTESRLSKIIVTMGSSGVLVCSIGESDSF